jgi:tight adherence protein B
MLRRLTALVAAAAIAGLLVGPAVAADSSSLDVLGVDGRTVRLLLTFAPQQEVTKGTPVSATLEVDGRQVAADAELVIDDTRPTTAILALDASGSMRGDRMTAARAAANQFLDALPPNVEAGLVSFNDRIDVRSQPTTERAALKRQIGSLRPGGDTALYDAVKAALTLVPAGSKARVLVLSDGQDTSSSAKLKDLTRAVKESGIPVDVVAVEPTTKQLEILRSLSAQNAGSLQTATSSEDLLATFSAASRDYGARAYLTGVVPDGVDARGKQVSAQVRVANQAIDAAATLPHAPSLSASWTGDVTGVTQQAPYPAALPAAETAFSPWPFAFGLLGFVLVMVLAAAVFWWRERVRARRRLHQVLSYQVGVGAEQAATVEPGLVVSLVNDLDRLLARGKGYRGTEIRLAAADVKFTPAVWLLIRISVIVAILVALLVLTGSQLLSLLVAVVVGWLLTRMWLGSRVAKRQKAFADYLPDFLLLLASGLRAGLSFTSALDSVAEEGTSEVARQMRRALGEVQLGAKLDDALNDCAERMDSEDLRWTVTALSIQREVGGNLSAILESAAATIKQRWALRREVATLSAEGRFSGYVLIALPLGVAAFLLVFRREYIAVMWQTAFGLLMLGTIIVLMVVGWIWMRVIVRIKV